MKGEKKEKKSVNGSLRRADRTREGHVPSTSPVKLRTYGVLSLRQALLNLEQWTRTERDLTAGSLGVRFLVRGWRMGGYLSVVACRADGGWRHGGWRILGRERTKNRQGKKQDGDAC